MRSNLARLVADELDEHPPEKSARNIGGADYPRDDDPDVTEEDYCRYTVAFVQEQQPGVEHLHNTWIQNLLFLSGLHWHRMDAVRGTWERIKAPAWKEFPVTNLCVPFFKHIMAKLTKNRPAWITIPGSTDPEDVHSAELADQVLRSKWTELRMARRFRRAIAWLIPTGNAFFYPFWDTNSGRLKPLTAPVLVQKINADTGEPEGMEEIECPCDENGEPIMDEAGNLDLNARPHFIDEGEIGCKVYSGFQVYVDSMAESDEELTTVVIVEPMPIRELERQYPRIAGQVVGEDIGMLDQYDRLVNGVLAGSDTQINSGHAIRDDETPKVCVYHYHEKPCPEYPGGRYWKCTSTVMLEPPQPLPEPVWPPIVHLTDMEVPGRYHAAATMEAVVGLNREYNECNAMIKEHHNLLLRGKWLVPIGSNIRKGQITSQPGEVIQHTPGLPPVQADIKALPQQVYLERERILKDFQLVSGINKVSMGQAPTGVTAARAFLILQEADDTDLGPMLQMLEEATADLAWKFLQIMSERYDDERLVHIVGANRKYQVRAFRGSDLRGVMDIVPQAGSAAPWSQTARQSLLIELMKIMPAMFINDETGMIDKVKVAQMLPIAGFDVIETGADLDTTDALNEEDFFRSYVPGMASAEEVPMPQPWQNVEIHDRCHTELLKTAEFKRWPPEAQAAMIAHWQQTRTLRDMERQRRAMLAGLAAGKLQMPGDAPPSEAEDGGDEGAA